MQDNPAKNLSTMRREKALRARQRGPASRSPAPMRSLVGPFRLFLTGFALSLCLAAAERFAAFAVARWLDFPAVAAGPGLTVFPAVAVPFAFAALFGPAAAIAQGVAASLVMWAALRFNPCTLVSMLCGTLMVPAFAQKVRKGSDIAKIAASVFVLQCVLCGAATAVCATTAPSLDSCEAWEAAALAVLHILSVPFCVSILLPAAESVSGLVSDRTLASFANLENPLLQRLSREAPGTYGHSMVVADLASAAAEAVGANPLMARLGGYYHDIGKLANPRFFMENQTMLGNPHDALPPSVSAMIIASHVKDGLVLARDAGLPRSISRIIACHHGTSAMEWFRLKAVKLAGGEGTGAARRADSWPYRYCGPLPETREETIVSIADGVEAASRSLSSPGQPEIARLVDNTVSARLTDGQFARSALTMAELEDVKRALTEVLIHRLHARAAYPGQNNAGAQAKRQGA